MKQIFVIISLFSLIGCLSVRQEDLDSWVNQPVELLDAHPFFMTVPLEKRYTKDGVEIRNYRNGISVNQCASNINFGYNYTYANAYRNCYQRDVVCNNIFYIKNKRVLRYEPTGRCYTDASVQPRKMY